jgi:FtsZ-binding cell division protein ZapB
MPKISILEQKLSKEELKEVNNSFINLFKDLFKRRLDELYLECEHGDKEHRKWLKNKFDDFYKNNIE